MQKACLLPREVMKEAYLLLDSIAEEGEQTALTSHAVVRLDRVAGPYAAILRVRGSGSEIQELAKDVGITARDVCWLAETGVKGGDALA